MNTMESRDENLTPDVAVATAESYPSNITMKHKGSGSKPPSYDTIQTKSDETSNSAMNPAYEKDDTFLWILFDLTLFLIFQFNEKK